MFIYLNGKKEYIEENMSISKLLERKKIRQEVVTVEHNGQIIGREEFKDTFLNEGDGIEFVYYMGGGWWNLEFGMRMARWQDGYGIGNSECGIRN
jgi:sulfur carrier protein